MQKASTKESFPTMETNLGKIERGLSVLAGSYFMYKAFKKGGYLKAALGAYFLFRGASGYCPASQLFGKTSVLKNHNINSKISIIVKRQRKEVYEFWRKLEHFPMFMQHLQEVRVLDEKTSVWKASGPGKLPGLVWISEIVEDKENERIGWKSLKGSDIENYGNVHFRDTALGTEVNLVISYRPQAGKVGETVGKMLNPALDAMIREDMDNFRWIMETGGLPTQEHVLAK